MVGGRYLKKNAIPVPFPFGLSRRSSSLSTSSGGSDSEPDVIDSDSSSSHRGSFEECGDSILSDVDQDDQQSFLNSENDQEFNPGEGCSLQFQPDDSTHQCTEDLREDDAGLDENNNTYSEANSNIRKSDQMILTDLLVTDKEVNTWTGLSSTDQLTEICLAVRTLESNSFPRKFKMHASDRTVLTLVKLKQNLSFEAIATLFRISGPTVANYFSHTLQILSLILKKFIYWPTKEELRQNVPLCFREHFSNVTVVLDATEIPIATLKCLNCRIASYSNYKSRRTVKFLIGVSPAGLITFVSQAYSGKSSDKFIVNEEKLMDRLEAHSDEIMVDKGVSIESECSTKCIKLHMPPFMKGDKLTPQEASRNEAIARARVHVERAIQRIKIFGIFSSTINLSMLGNINDIMTVVCGIVNLSPPILNDDKF